jgi:hypothetical protein
MDFIIIIVSMHSDSRGWTWRRGSTGDDARSEQVRDGAFIEPCLDQDFPGMFAEARRPPSRPARGLRELHGNAGGAVSVPFR